MAAQLQPLTAPGIALFPEYITQQPVTLRVQGEFMTGRTNITLPNDEPLFRVVSDILPMAHARNVIDVRSGRKLCTIKRHLSTMVTPSWKYYAERPEDRARFLEFASDSFLSGQLNQLSFANVVDGGKSCQLEYHNKTFSAQSPISFNGVPVAIVEVQRVGLQIWWNVHIAPGMDMFLAVAFVLILKDKKEKSQSSKPTAGGTEGDDNVF